MANLTDTQTDHHDRAEERRRDFEQQVVCKMLTHGGKIHLLRQFKDELAAETGARRLTLEWLACRYPRFPLRLGAVLLEEDSPTVADVFKRYTKTPFFEAYRRWRQEHHLDDHDDRMGIVFNTERVTCVLHNHDALPVGHAWRVVRPIGQPPVTFVLQRLSSLLDSIGPGWADM